MLVQPVARGFVSCLIAACLAFWLAGSREVTAVQAATVEARPDTVVALLPKVIPTVVAIHTRRVVRAAGDPVKPDQAPKIERAEGSGFIVSADGFIATNKHVVSGAYDVAVVLHDGATIRAKIIWESAVVDVAFLKIEAGHPLQAATLAPDGSLSLGERVVAIGNPMGLGISATAGIVSALRRNLDQSPYDDFIQTDAAINYGNSGGPLFDLAGDVVGMNSILWTAGTGQGSQGLGFAIPGADITFLIDQLKRDGRIACGVLGARAQKLTSAIASGIGFPGHGGVIVATIDGNSAAAKAGLRPGDVLQTFNGEALVDTTTLNRAACRALGRTVSMELWRQGHFQTLEARVMTEQDGKEGPESRFESAPPRLASAADLGLSLAPADRPADPSGSDSGGAVIVSVSDASEAQVAGLSSGDVIISLQMIRLTKDRTFDEVFAQCGREGRRSVLAMVREKGGERWITLPVRIDASATIPPVK